MQGAGCRMWGCVSPPGLGCGWAGAHREALVVGPGGHRPRGVLRDVRDWYLKHVLTIVTMYEGLLL